MRMSSGLIPRLRSHCTCIDRRSSPRADVRRRRSRLDHTVHNRLADGDDFVGGARLQFRSAGENLADAITRAVMQPTVVAEPDPRIAGMQRGAAGSRISLMDPVHARQINRSFHDLRRIECGLAGDPDLLLDPDSGSDDSGAGWRRDASIASRRKSKPPRCFSSARCAWRRWCASRAACAQHPETIAPAKPQVRTVDHPSATKIPSTNDRRRLV